MKKNPTLVVVAAALIDPSNRVLLQRRSPGRAMAGLWEFPGGKVEPDEIPEKALVRELREELDIDVALESLRPVGFASAPNGDRHMLLLLFHSREWSGDPKPLDASELRWLRPAEMLECKMPPADAPFIPLLDRML